MKTKIMIAFFVLGVLTLKSFAQTNSIDYLGQTPPGNKAVKFAPGIISLPNRGEYSIVFSPDGNEAYPKGIYILRLLVHGEILSRKICLE